MVFFFEFKLPACGEWRFGGSLGRGALVEVHSIKGLDGVSGCHFVLLG